MIVKDILKAKPNNEVIATRPSATVAEASGILAERNIGALVVLENGGGTLRGIISERDIVRGLARHGDGALTLPVSALMTAEVVVCNAGDSLERLMETMTRNRIRHLPVMEGIKLAGMITIGDVVKSRLDEMTSQVDQMREYVMTTR